MVKNDIKSKFELEFISFNKTALSRNIFNDKNLEKLAWIVFPS